MDDYILKMTNIDKSFHDVQVLKDVCFDLRAGEVHALLGENGAGKSTLIKILSAVYRKETGKIYLDGEEMNAVSPREAMDAGIAVIFQELNLNPHATIYDNIFMGREYEKNGSVDKSREIKEAKELLERMELNVDPCTEVGDLSTAQKQIVEICKALSIDSKVIVFDEPTASITDKETELLFKIINQLKEERIGIVYISHRMEEIFTICDRCTVMRDGETVQTLNVKDTNADKLTELMVGRKVDFSRNLNPYVTDDIALSVENICYKQQVKNVSFVLKKGEILGIAGLVGAGRTELAKCIVGALNYDSGNILFEGKTPLKKHSIQDSLSHGVVYLSEDRKDEGLVLIHSVADNTALPNLGKLFKRKLVSQKKIRDFAGDYVKKLRVKTSSLDQECQNLSGGNQQKVVIAKWLGFNASVYIFDEPTRGIDVGARSEIYGIMNDLLDKGASIIMISSDLVEVLKMSDRVMVMKEGEISAILDNSDVITQKQVMSYAM